MMLTETHAALHHAQVLLDRHRGTEAAALVASVLGREPENVTAWLLMAMIRLELDDPAGALDAAGTAVGLAPGTGNPLALTGLALSGLGRHDDAVTAGYRAVCAEPDEPLLHDVYARLVLSAGYDPADAERAARMAVTLAPEYADHHVTLGVTLAARGRRGEAREALLTALRLDPQAVDARRELAFLDADGRNPLAAGRLAGAATGFADTLRTDPREQAGRLGLDLTLRTFLIRTAWLLFLLCFFAARLASQGQPGWAGVLAVLGVVLSAAYAWRFVDGLDRNLRQYLVSLVTTGRRRRAAIGAAVSALLMVSAVGAPTSWVPGLLVAAAVAALLVRITTTAETNDHARSAGVSVPYVLGTASLALIGCLTGLIGLFIVAVGVSEGRAQATVGGAALLAVTAYVVRTIVRRRR